MELVEKIKRLVVANTSIYQCWMCGKGHNNPTAYLWHINACELETTGKSMLLTRQKAMLPVMIIKQ
jgi:hypothetical protein